MKSKRRINPYLFTGFFICLLFVLGSFKIGLLKENVTKQNIPIKNRVSNLTVIESSIQDNTIFMTLRNDSSKTITAFSVYSAGITTRHEFLGGTNAISPGETYSNYYELSNSSSDTTSILAVVYEDGTTGGEPKFIKQILDARAGKQDQLQRILPILEDSLATTKNVTLEEKWQKNISKIQNLPISKEGESFEYNAALQNQKNAALMKGKEFEQIKQQQGENVAVQMLTYTKEEYEQKNQQLRSVLKKQQ